MTEERSMGLREECFSWSQRRLSGFRLRLLAWYLASARDLPWRKTRDPYRIWVSEIMLQQTRVVVAVPYYERFLERFPMLETLAHAHIEEVLPFWSGLGYYRRIRNLHRAAGMVMKEFGGVVPDRPDQLLTLPGIGKYTAGAILSLAYGKAEPVLDGNVQRVFCRLFAIDQDPGRSRIQKRLWALARHILPEERSGAFNQALMELGATLCSPGDPQCRDCPVRRYCLAAERNLQGQIPFRPVSPARIRQELAVFLLQWDRRLLLVRKEKDALVEGLWELPQYPVSRSKKGREEKGTALPSSLFRKVQTGLGFRMSSVQRIGEIKHSIMQRDLRMHVIQATVTGPHPRSPEPEVRMAWILPGEIRDFGISSASLKALRLWKKA